MSNTVFNVKNLLKIDINKLIELYNKFHVD